MLEDIGEPAEHPIEQVFAPVADVVFEVFLELLAAAFLARFDGKTFPQIKIAWLWLHTLRCKGNALELAALGAGDPDFRDRNLFAIIHFDLLIGELQTKTVGRE